MTVNRQTTSVRVELGFTKNLGNFENIKVSIAVEDYVRDGEFEFKANGTVLIPNTSCEVFQTTGKDTFKGLWVLDNPKIIRGSALKALENDPKYVQSITDLMDAVETITAQESLDFYEYANRQFFSDGTNMLTTMHQKGWLMKVKTDAISSSVR